MSIRELMAMLLEQTDIDDEVLINTGNDVYDIAEIVDAEYGTLINIKQTE